MPPDSMAGRPVFGCLPDWGLSGVNVYLLNLFRELREAGKDVSLILSNPKDTDRSWEAGFPGTVHRCRPTKASHCKSRQEQVRKFLLQNSPCVFFPNYDFQIFGICPLLPRDVITIGVIHSDADEYYSSFEQYGEYWNRSIAVSEKIASELRRRRPALADRVSVIPCGVRIPAEPPAKTDGRLRVCYCGRLVRRAKRVDILAAVILECFRRSLSVEFHIAGDGQDEAEFQRLVDEPLRAGMVCMLGRLSNEQTLELLGESDAMILTSDFEGFPVVLVEAMSRACVPVVSKVESGVQDLIVDGQTGFLVNVGDVAGFCANLEQLANDRVLLRKMGSAAFATISESPCSSGHMARSYLGLFRECEDEIRSGAYARPRGSRVIPEEFKFWNRVKASLRLRTRLRQVLGAPRTVRDGC